MVKARVLCMDNDSMLLDLIASKLEDLFEIETIRESTLEGMKSRISEGHFDLITMGLLYPVDNPEDQIMGFGGLTFLQELRNGMYGAKISGISVVIISYAQNVADNLDDIISPRGNTWFVGKPFSLKNLSTVIQEALDASNV